jgi:hypothetical protein
VFETLGNRLQGVFDRLRGRGALSEADVSDALREVRVALLEADVALSVVKDITARVRERAVGQEVIRSIQPGQQVVKIVNDALVEALGGNDPGPRGISLDAAAPVAILMVGLQGSGKTTTSGKIALRLKGRGVKLTGEKEFVAKNGKRTRGGGSGDVASQGFTKEFTEKFEALGEAIPVFSELRSLFDMSIAAAFIQERDLYAKSGWHLGVFADEAKLNVTSNPTITQVESAVNAVWKNGQLITPIGGGVHIAARKLVAEENVSVDRAIDGQSSAMSAPSDLREGQWWWD